MRYSAFSLKEYMKKSQFDTTDKSGAVSSITLVEYLEALFQPSLIKFAKVAPQPRT